MSDRQTVFLVRADMDRPRDAHYTDFDLVLAGSVERFSIGCDCDRIGMPDIVEMARNLADVTIAITLRDIEQRGAKVSCHKGCHAACCRYLMVSLSVPEALRFAQEVASLPPEQQSVVEQNCRTSARIIQDHMQNRQVQTHNISPDRNTILDWYMELGLPCNFLYDNCCQIYPQRSITCRECLVVSPAAACDRDSTGTVQKVHLPVRIANVLTALWAQLLQTTDDMIILPCVFDWLDNNRTLLDKKWPADFLINKFVAILIENNRVLCQKMTAPPTSSY